MPDLAVVIDKARNIVGNKPDNSAGDQYVPDDAINTALAPVVRDLNSLYGNASGLKEVTFTLTPNQQDYPLSTLGTDVFEVSEVIRSAAYVPDGVLTGGEIDPQTGLPAANRSTIPQGYQGDALEVIIGQWRHRHADRFDWEVVNGDTLRLMPKPVTAEVCVVRYVADNAAFETLPDNTETCLVFAACVAILNGQINRINSSRQMTDAYGQAQTQRLQVLIKQRDYYQTAFEREFGRMAG